MQAVIILSCFAKESTDVHCKQSSSTFTDMEVENVAKLQQVVA